MTSLTGAERSNDGGRLAQLYAISTVLLRSADIERSFPEIVRLVARELPLRSAYLGLDAHDHAVAFVVEDPAAPVERRVAARAHARDAYDYLTSRGHRVADDEIVVHEAPSSRVGPDRVGALLVLPLVLARSRVLGVLQLETADRADEAALWFLGALVSQLALALDRRSEARAEIAAADRYSALVDGLDQAFVWECDVETLAIHYVSARASRYLGVDGEALRTRDWTLLDLTLAEDRELLRRGLVDATNGVASIIDHRCQSREGRTFWFHTTVHLSEPSGARARLQGISFDITGLKRAEQSQRLLAELSAAVGHTLDEAETMTALVKFVSQTICEVAILEILDEHGAMAARESARRDGEPVDSYALLAHVSEQDSVVILPLVARNRTMGVLTLFGLTEHPSLHLLDEALLSDIARRASIALDNARLFGDAERARRLRDDMLAVVSHDLKNPVHAIILYTETLLHSPAHASMQKPLRSIRRSADKMSRLLRDLLDAASIESGRFSIERVSTEVAPLLSDALEPFVESASQKGVELRVAAPRHLPRILVDPQRFVQVIGNLVGNAIKFTPAEGAVVLKAEATASGVRFSVIDTGPGIAEADLGHVFDRFWQARETARLGTGLGLFIARAIVEDHGGKLTVHSAHAAGTTFCFEIAFATK